MKTLIIMGLLSLALLPTAQSQDLQQDMASVMQFYLNSDSLCFQTDIKAFHKATDVKPFYVEKAIYAHANEQVFLDFNGLIRLVNEKEVVVIDKKNKLINVLEKSENSAKSERGELAELIDETIALSNTANDIQFEQLENGNNKYTLFPEVEDFSKIEIEFSKSMNFIASISYFYNKTRYPDTEKSVVQYQQVSRTPFFDISRMSTEKYLSKAKGLYQLNKAYEDYELVVYENE